jgi:hypothetical protein
MRGVTTRSWTEDGGMPTSSNTTLLYTVCEGVFSGMGIHALDAELAAMEKLGKKLEYLEKPLDLAAMERRGLVEYDDLDVYPHPAHPRPAATAVALTAAGTLVAVAGVEAVGAVEAEAAHAIPRTSTVTRLMAAGDAPEVAATVTTSLVSPKWTQRAPSTHRLSKRKAVEPGERCTILTKTGEAATEGGAHTCGSERGEVRDSDNGDDDEDGRGTKRFRVKYSYKHPSPRAPLPMLVLATAASTISDAAPATTHNDTTANIAPLAVLATRSFTPRGLSASPGQVEQVVNQLITYAEKEAAVAVAGDEDEDSGHEEAHYTLRCLGARRRPRVRDHRHFQDTDDEDDAAEEAAATDASWAATARMHDLAEAVAAVAAPAGQTRIIPPSSPEVSSPRGSQLPASPDTATTTPATVQRRPQRTPAGQDDDLDDEPLSDLQSRLTSSVSPSASPTSIVGVESTYVSVMQGADVGRREEPGGGAGGTCSTPPGSLEASSPRGSQLPASPDTATTTPATVQRRPQCTPSQSQRQVIHQQQQRQQEDDEQREEDQTRWQQQQQLSPAAAAVGTAASPPLADASQLLDDRGCVEADINKDTTINDNDGFDLSPPSRREGGRDANNFNGGLETVMLDVDTVRERREEIGLVTATSPELLSAGRDVRNEIGSLQTMQTMLEQVRDEFRTRDAATQRECQRIVGLFTDLQQRQRARDIETRGDVQRLVDFVSSAQQKQHQAVVAAVNGKEE